VVGHINVTPLGILTIPGAFRDNHNLLPVKAFDLGLESYRFKKVLGSPLELDTVTGLYPKGHKYFFLFAGISSNSLSKVYPSTFPGNEPISLCLFIVS